MKRLIFAISLLLVFPTLVLALPTTVNRLTDHIEPLIKSDFFKGSYYVATTTTATSTYAGAIQIGATTADHAFTFVAPSRTYSTSVSVGGAANWTFTNSNNGMYLYSAGTGTLLSVDCNNAAMASQCLRLQSSDASNSTLNVQGQPFGLGVIKASASGDQGNSGSILSLDATTNSNTGQGIFVKCNNATTTACVQLRDGLNNTMFKVDGFGLTTIRSMLQLTATTSSMLATDDSGNVYATTTPSAANFRGSSATVASYFPLLLTGPATSSGFAITGVKGCSGSSALTTDSNGNLLCGAISGTGGAWPFTPSTNFNTSVSATSTPIFDSAGLQASSTSQFQNVNTWGVLALSSSTATTTSASAFQFGSTARDSLLYVNCNGRVWPSSVTTGGCVNIDMGTTNTGAGIVVDSNAAMTGRMLVLSNRNSGTTAETLLASSTASNASTIGVIGAPTGKGIIKVTHSGAGNGFANSSGLSIDLLNCTDCQGLFIDRTGGAGTGRLLNLKDNGSVRLFLSASGGLGIPATTSANLLGTTGDGTIISTTTFSITSATSTYFGANTICLSNDCRSAWPTSGSGAWPFNSVSNFNTTTAATGTPMWDRNGLFASSTSQFVNANIWGLLNLPATTSSILATDDAGNVVASSSLYVSNETVATNLWLKGLNYNGNPSILIGDKNNNGSGLVGIYAGSSCSGGQFASAIAQDGTFTCGTPAGGGTWPFTIGASTYATTTQSTTTPFWFRNVFFASTTASNPAIIDNLKSNNATTSSLYVGAYRAGTSTADYLDIQNNNNAPYSLLRVVAPSGQHQESTLALHINVDGVNDSGNDEFLDVYNEHYPDSLQAGFRMAYTGTGLPKPIIFGTWDKAAGSAGKDQGNKLIIMPSGTVAVAQATSTLTLTTAFQIASSTATNLLQVDTTPGTSKLTVANNGNVTVGSGALIVNGNAQVNSGNSLVLRNAAGNSDIFAFNNGASGANQLYISDFTTTMPILLDGKVTISNGFISNASSTVVGPLTMQTFNASSSTGTSTVQNALQLGPSARDSKLYVNCDDRVYPSSVTTGGCLNFNMGTTNTGAGLVIDSNAAMSGRMLVLSNRNSATTGETLFASSTASNASTIGVIGAPTGKGIIKISHSGAGTGFANAAGISIDLLNAQDAQGVFVKGATSGTGKLLNIVDSSSNTLLNFSTTGALTFGATTTPMLAAFEPGGVLAATSTPIMRAFNATTTTATSTIMGKFAVGTTTPIYRTTFADPKFPQLVLADGNGSMNWTMRNAGGTLFIATSTQTATSTTAAIAIDSTVGPSLFVATTTNNAAVLAVDGRYFHTNLTNSNTGDYVCYNTVSGEIEQNATACSLSSIRFKTDIQPYSLGINALMQLRPVTFYFKPGFGQDTAKQQEGFIAEEVNKVDPLLVSRDTSGQISGLDYPKFVVMLVKSVQELFHHDNEQDKKIQQLEAEIAQLKAQLK